MKTISCHAWKNLFHIGHWKLIVTDILLVEATTGGVL